MIERENRHGQPALKTLMNRASFFAVLLLASSFAIAEDILMVCEGASITKMDPRQVYDFEGSLSVVFQDDEAVVSDYVDESAKVTRDKIFWYWTKSFVDHQINYDLDTVSGKLTTYSGSFIESTRDGSTRKFWKTVEVATYDCKRLRKRAID